MTQNNVDICDADDSTSNTTVDSEEDNIECSVPQSQSQYSLNVSQINANNLQLPTFHAPDKASIPHISSVALQNSSDITFGNKMLYNGPITVNQYGVGVERPMGTGNCLKDRWKVILTTAIIIVTFLISVATILTLQLRHVYDDTDGVTNIDNDETPLVLVSRVEWRARPATGVIEDLMTPVHMVVIQHTVQSSCNTMGACASLVRQIQTQHIKSKNIGDDIGYNFLVGGDGAAYEGRGWDKLGAHTYGYNRKSIGVAFIGDFRNEAPTNQQVVALLKLLRNGVGMGKVSENYTLIGATQVQQTESPGKLLYQILTKLPHWSDVPD